MNADLQYLEFEKPVLDIEARIRDLVAAAESGAPTPVKDTEEELGRLSIKKSRVLRLLYRHLTPWQKVMVARHPQRPHATAYIHALFSDFIPLAGDKAFADDKAVIAGLARLKVVGTPVAVIGIEKGDSATERVARNFGMPKPDGYRKAKRVMELAHKFGLPILTFIDTPGAYPGVDAEARGQAETIARCIETLLSVDVPVVATIIGEGGSGGALALGVADKVFMLEHSIYSVISPEGCASILWKDADRDTIAQAAEALKLTAEDLLKLGVIDALIREPVGGAHRDHTLAFERVASAIATTLAELTAQQPFTCNTRREKFLALGRT
jgi:acetyl-CoA carboxylase carboxyl transferase subunit alpha